MKKLIYAFLLLIAPAIVKAQNLIVPEASQKAMVMQRIGLTDITISYHSPLAKERKIWGGIVPYNEVWRAGANENTAISFSTEVMVEGKPIAAGTYGLHMIPTENEWTLIFSKNSTSWGSFFYDKNEDALRVNVKPAAMAYQNWLSYGFENITDNSVSAILKWEKISVSFKIEANVKEVVYQSMKDELRGLDGFTWQAPLQAARYCMNNKIHLDEAMAWADKSIQTQENFGNLMAKSQLLALKGQTAEADALNKKAMTVADETQMNQYGYDLMGQKKNKEAIDVFKTNVKRYPNSWNVYDSLGEAYDLDGNKKEALANYKTALSKAPENQKARIQGIVANIEKK